MPRPEGRSRERGVRRHAASQGSPHCLAPEALVAGHTSGRSQPGASRLLPRRVYVPVQPSHLAPPRAAVLPADGAGGGRRPAALCRHGQKRARSSEGRHPQPIVAAGVKGIPIKAVHSGPLQSLAQPESGLAHHFDVNISRAQPTTDQGGVEAGCGSPASPKLGYFCTSRFALAIPGAPSPPRSR